MPRAPEQADFIALGHIARPHGVHGALIIAPYTENPDIILRGRHLKLKPPDGPIRSVASLAGKEAAQGLIVKIAGLSSRDEAKKLAGWTIGIFRSDLPPLSDDEIYWADLLGLDAYSKDGALIGRVLRLLDAGAGLLLVIEPPGEPGREMLVPYNEKFVPLADPAARRLVIDPPQGLLEL